MNERLRESLSAVLDGEANELELERVLSQIGDNAELRQTWVRYSAVRSASAGGAVANLSLDISQRVSSAVQREHKGDHSHGLSGRARQWLKPLASFAVAASVTATVVIGGQQLAQIGQPGSQQSLIAGTSVVGLINTVGATPILASYGTQLIPALQPTAKTAYRELARQRMQKYMQEHVEHTALNTPQGLIPFARIQQIQE